MENSPLTPEVNQSSAKQILILAVIYVVILTAAVCVQSYPKDNLPVKASYSLAGFQFPDLADALASDGINTAQYCVIKIPRPVYEIAPDALAGQMPNPDCYGTTDDPATLQWLLDEAARILDGQDTLFRTDMEIYPNSSVTYYLDETIFAISWKQVIDNFVYTFAEVKVAHPSQFRRYLVNGEFNSKPLYTTARMAPMVNAVVASSGDYYRGRKHGIVVYEGIVHRFHASELIDTCFVDLEGNLVLKPKGTFSSKDEAQKFVDDNNISFSLSFGPILIQDGKRCEPSSYGFGEINDKYPRAALCQRDELHYVVITANGDGRYWNYPTIHDFAENLDAMGFESAYSLDGGNTGTIVMNNTVQNPINPGKMRAISDCLYFATAYPNEDEKAGS